MNQLYRREEGMRLLAEGVHPVEVATRVGVTEMTAYRWRKRDAAERSIRTTTVSGRPPLRPAEIKRLGEIIDTKAPRQFNWSVHTRSGGFNLPNIRALVINDYPASHEATLRDTGLKDWLKRNGFVYHRRWMTLELRTAQQERQASIRAARQQDS